MTYPYSEDELLPISALSHLKYCERRCALIHIEQVWSENRLTAEGQLLHEKVHEREDESRGDLRIARGLRLRSLALGLYGVADVVEFHKQPDGSWQAFPVEYKRGKPKPNICDEVQLCAQAMCLGEMLNTQVSCGAVFYGLPRRRMDVEITPSLREQTESAAKRLHELIRSGVTPTAEYEKKCRSCSLFDLCMPKRIGGGKRNVDAYLKEMIA